MWDLNHEEGWVLKKIDVFELWYWRRLLTARRSNWSILKEINPEYSLGGLMLKSKLQYFGYLIWIAKSLEKALMLGKIEVRRRKWQKIKWFDGITDSMDVNLNKHQEMVKDREARRATVHGVTKSWTLLSNWTKKNNVVYVPARLSLGVKQGYPKMLIQFFYFS